MQSSKFEGPKFRIWTQNALMGILTKPILPYLKKITGLNLMIDLKNVEYEYVSQQITVVCLV